MTERFNVVFAGEIAGRADPAVVRANLGRLFNASDAVLDKLFSGQPVVIKKMVDRETAMLLRARMKQAGANTSMIQVDAEGKPLPQNMAERVQALAEQHAREEAAKPKPNAPPPPADIARTETWALYPVGWLLSVPLVHTKPVVLPVITGISLAPMGTDLIAEAEKEVAPPVKVDLSGISMAPPGTEVLRANERRPMEVVEVDISGISMAAVGASLDEIREEKVLVNPDISHLSLASEK